MGFLIQTNSRGFMDMFPGTLVKHETCQQHEELRSLIEQTPSQSHMSVQSSFYADTPASTPTHFTMPTQQTATHTQNVMTTSQQNASMPSQPISAPISTPTQSVGTQQLVQPAVTSQPQCTPQQTTTQHVVEKTAAPPETVHHATILTSLSSLISSPATNIQVTRCSSITKKKQKPWSASSPLPSASACVEKPSRPVRRKRPTAKVIDSRVSTPVDAAGTFDRSGAKEEVGVFIASVGGDVSPKRAKREVAMAESFDEDDDGDELDMGDDGDDLDLGF
eukprot:206114_1